MLESFSERLLQQDTKSGLFLTEIHLYQIAALLKLVKKSWLIGYISSSDSNSAIY